MVACNICSQTFARKDVLLRHMREVHGQVRWYQCQHCDKQYKRRYDLNHHKLVHTTVKRKAVSEAPVVNKVARIDESVFVSRDKGRYKNVQQWFLVNVNDYDDLWQLYRHVKKPLKKLLTQRLQDLNALKFDLVLKVTFEKATDANETIACYFHSKVKIVSIGRHLGRYIHQTFVKLNTAVEDYIERGSGWVVRSIDKLDVNVVKYQPIKAGTFVPLPKNLALKKAIVNVKNNDNKCFMWAVLSALHPVDGKQNPNRVVKYERFATDLCFDGIDFPVKLDDIITFETLNDISINVYGYDDRLKIMRISEHRSTRRISLLLLHGKRYCWIKHPERLFNTQKTDMHRLFQCHFCLCLFYTAEKRDKHMERCENPDLDTIEMPTEDNKWLYFTNYHKMLRQPYIIYADFECLLEKLDTCSPAPSTSYTYCYQRHTPCGYGIAEVFGCCNDKQKLGETHTYRGEDTVEKFLSHVINWGERHQKRYDQQKPVTMTQQDWWHFNATKTCLVCYKRLEDEDKVLDHCHFCGQYRGAAHNACNINYRLTRDVVVVMHNLRRYDGHLLLEKLGKVANEKKIDIFVIPKGTDDFLTIALRMKHNKCSWTIKFVDSYQFLSTSLEKLVDGLKNKGTDKFIHMASTFTCDDLSLLLRKGVYPYDYMDNWQRFEETSLPSIEAFYSTLSDANIEETDYAHAENVWRHFGIKNLGQYHDLYLLTDVLLLADVFENFRNVCLSTYSLDAVHYYTAPAFSWDACLKFTGVRLELLTDPDMYKFFEDGIRGGVAQISHRYARANNPYLEDLFDSSNSLSYIIYKDMNNLYGWTMAEPLPISNFRWLDEDEIAVFDVMNVQDDGKTGYVLEVDLDYPNHIHDSHNDYPLAVERLTIKDDMLSPYCQEVKSALKQSGCKVEKLVPNLCNKTKYKVHFRNLKLYLQLGLKLKRIHRVLSFNQARWMAPYILFNTEMRKKTSSKFEEDLFKLYNNSVFGKTMENVRRYKNIKIVCNEDSVVKLASKMNYCGFKKLADNLWAVKMEKDVVKLNKPVYVGFSVLDLSKWLMYDYHYNYIKPKYGARATLLMTDTDSLIYHIFTDDIYEDEDMREDKQLFDFSEYPGDHPCFDLVNKKVMGKMKDELKGVPVVEFVGLRAKMYSILDKKGREKKRAKGVKRGVVDVEIKHELYKQVLFDCKQLKHTMKFIRASGVVINSVVQNKTSLSPYDDKRYVLLDRYSTAAYGHCNIMSCDE